MRRSVFSAIGLILVISLGGCANIDRKIDELAHTGDAIMPPDHFLRETIYFAADGDVPVRSQPSATSSVVGYLSRHEPVTRRGLQEGFAYITTDGDLNGWVAGGLLLSHLPETPGHSAHIPPVHNAPPAASSSDAPSAKENPAVSGSNTADAEPAPAAPVVPADAPEPAEPAPEMLNPF